MTRENQLRRTEQTVAWPERADAALIFIGRIRTPWTSRIDCPRQGRKDGPLCRIEVFPPWDQALRSIDLYREIEVLYWLHRSRRDLVLQSPADDGAVRGTFSLRSPLRPNPIATSIVSLTGIEGSTLLVRGLDCLDETPLIDLKPDRCAFTPIALPTKGDSDVDPALGA
jgi:tRNA-Thr(GGU) m(6)t(6)A37 methyltransferase TsaA